MTNPEPRLVHTERHERWAKCLYPDYNPAKILAEEWSRDVIERAMVLSDAEDDENHEYDGWEADEL